MPLSLIDETLGQFESSSDNSIDKDNDEESNKDSIYVVDT